MLWVLSTFLCILRKFFCLLVLQTMRGKLNLEVRIEQENIVDMHLFWRVDADNVAVSNQKPFWRVPIYHVCRC